MIKSLTISFLTLVAFFTLIACKDVLLGPTYPITNFNEYDCVVVATINKAVHENQKYTPLKTFNATIRKTLKGGLVIGSVINGKAKIEEPRAVCPVHLNENSDYLLLLSKSNDEYTLSRFSFPVKKGEKYFDDYLIQIEKQLNK